MVKPNGQRWMQAEGQHHAVNTLGNWCLTLYRETEERKALIQWFENGIKSRTSPSAYEFHLALTQSSDDTCPPSYDKNLYFFQTTVIVKRSC